jgi:hypothetical protein
MKRLRRLSGMANTKVITAQQRTNRNNKERGKAFEKRMAEVLGWFRVPMSGSSAVFGWCDVRDAEKKGDGIWLGECKTMTPSNPEHRTYTIELQWLNKLLYRSDAEMKMPVLLFTLYGDSAKFVAMPVRLFEIIERICQYINPIYFDIKIKRMSDKHKNYTLSRDYFMDHRFRSIRRAKMNTAVWRFGFEDEKSGSGWVIMHLDDFMRFHKDPRLDLAHKEYTAILQLR